MGRSIANANVNAKNHKIRCGRKRLQAELNRIRSSECESSQKQMICNDFETCELSPWHLIGNKCRRIANLVAPCFWGAAWKRKTHDLPLTERVLCQLSWRGLLFSLDCFVFGFLLGPCCRCRHITKMKVMHASCLSIRSESRFAHSLLCCLTERERLRQLANRIFLHHQGRKIDFGNKRCDSKGGDSNKKFFDDFEIFERLGCHVLCFLFHLFSFRIWFELIQFQKIWNLWNLLLSNFDLPENRTLRNLAQSHRRTRMSH